MLPVRQTKRYWGTHLRPGAPLVAAWTRHSPPPTCALRKSSVTYLTHTLRSAPHARFYHCSLLSLSQPTRLFHGSSISPGQPALSLESEPEPVPSGALYAAPQTAATLGHQYHTDLENQLNEYTDPKNLQLFTRPNKSLELIFPHQHTLENQLAVVQVCLVSGDFARAKRMLDGLYHLHPKELREAVDISTHNTLLNGLVSQKPTPQIAFAVEWFRALRGYKVTPNADTYAIMMKGFLATEHEHIVESFLKDFRLKGFSEVQLLHSSYLPDETLIKLVPLLSIHEAQKKSLRPEMQRFLEAITKPSGATNSEPSPSDMDTSPTTKNPQGTIERSTNTLGVSLLQQTLGALSDPQYALLDKQYRIEQESLDASVVQMSEARKARNDPFRGLNIKPLEKYIVDWHAQLTDLIKQELQLINRSNFEDPDNQARITYGPFLKALAPEKVAIATIMSVLELFSAILSRNSEADSVRATQAILVVAKRIEDEYNLEQMRSKSNAEVISRYVDTNNLMSSGRLFNMEVRNALAKIERENIATSWIPKWPQETKVRLGALLLSFLLDVVYIPIERPNSGSKRTTPRRIAAMYHGYRVSSGSRSGSLIFSRELLELLGQDIPTHMFSPNFLPMVVPPRSWLTYNSGGYLTLRNLSVRVKNIHDELLYLRKASDEGRLHTIHLGLDVLGKTQWRINRFIYDVLLKVWNSGQGLADIPPARLDVTMPRKPEDYDTDPKARRAYHLQCSKLVTAERNNHSLRCSANYVVEIARAFLDYGFYFPHNLDFRGRAYPIPPHFNHLGNDLSRGLLSFYVGKPLGARGLRWLRIQLANLYGFDKHSFDDREQFAIDHYEDVKDSALHPLDGKQWWLGAEDPWQCLATCRELYEALNSPDPEQYVSHLPIHQDGTCNGLQHYAALGGDRRGAEQVNLLPSESPQDVYSGVLKLVLEDIEKGVEKDDPMAILLQGKVNRKVIKQTVMTNVYGVTFIGARDQIMRRLKEREDVDDQMLYRLSGYLTHQVFRSLGEIFKCARQIQDWLNEAAKRISHSVNREDLERPTSLSREWSARASSKHEATKHRLSNSIYHLQRIARENYSSVIWTTPLNLTVVQPYRNEGTRIIKTDLQSIQIYDRSRTAPVDSRKQSTAFPPNFIHSLDATHMMLSAIECNRQGLVFASVHDSYWTHACDIDTMSTILRNEFIRLHRQPIMQNLLDEFKVRYANHVTPVVQHVPGKERHTKASKKDDGGGSSEDLPVDATAPAADISEPTSPEASMDGAVVDSDLDAAKKTGQGRPSTRKLIYKPLEFPPLPPRGDFDLNQVATSNYFFH
ncbi:DNA-directed RNA polymerase [Dimargaris verticillata]|uniref:DNA-directed RNA polymerase n=1 Tax=Dimargaris verticillata TaxID=2761393 RepID=A0A9W8B7C9_9FUNG|nr:DNA-directed RNA polymerase [Dimargaris verticillata]